eukprot:scaffold679577_cov71-Prasinocladus_malaysianus.AAC.1
MSTKTATDPAELLSGAWHTISDVVAVISLHVASPMAASIPSMLSENPEPVMVRNTPPSEPANISINKGLTAGRKEQSGVLLDVYT